METTKKQSLVDYVFMLIRFFIEVWFSWLPEVWSSVFKSCQHHGNPTLVLGWQAVTSLYLRCTLVALVQQLDVSP